MAENQNNPRTTNRVGGRNLVLPHVHDAAELTGVLSLSSGGAGIIPFDVIVPTPTTDTPTAGAAFATIPQMTSVVVLPPLTTPANKYRVHLRFAAQMEYTGESNLQVTFTQDAVAIGLQARIDEAPGGVGGISVLTLFHTYELAPGTYTLAVAWRNAADPAGVPNSPGLNRRFEIEVDNLVLV